MKNFIFALLLLTTLPIITFGQNKTNSEPKAKQNKISNEEYKFVSEILNSSEKFILINDKTIDVQIVNTQNSNNPSLGREDVSLDDLQDQIPNIAEDLIQDFNKKNEKTYLLKEEFDFTEKYKLISEDEIDKLFYEAKELDDRWEIFNKTYPNSFGWYQFSRVGFNKDKDQALIYLTTACGSLCGEGNYIFYVRENGKWKEEKKLMLWIA